MPISPVRAAIFALVVPIGLAFLAGCSSVFPSWDLIDYSKTNVTPEAGSYDFVLTPSAPCCYGGTFSVREKDGKPVLRFASDGYRFDEIPIRQGAFFRTWGQLGGTHCPTDSYGISGHFVSPTRAEGQIKYAYDCEVRKGFKFAATKR